MSTTRCENNSEQRLLHEKNVKFSFQDGATLFVASLAVGVAMREIGLPSPCLFGTVFAAAPAAALAHRWRTQPSRDWLNQNPPK